MQYNIIIGVNWTNQHRQWTNVNTTAKHFRNESTKWIISRYIISSCGPMFISGIFNGTVTLCKIKERSIYHLQYVLCDTPFVTYIYIYIYIYIYYMFQHKGAIFRDSSYQRYISTQQYMFHSSLYGVDICHKWCITHCMCWMIYGL
jgi:hypothetical protein